MALALVAFAGLLVVSIMTHSPADPIWAFGRVVENRCGPVGALLAGSLVRAMGWAAYVVPLAAGTIAVRYLRRLPLRPRWIPSSAWAVFWLSLAASFEALHQAFPGTIPTEAGGAVGGIVVAGLTGAFYLTGTALVVGIALLVSLIVATGISARDVVLGLLQVMRRATRLAIGVAIVLVVRLRRRWVRWTRASLEVRVGALDGNRGQRLRRSLRPGRRSPEPEVVEHRVASAPPLRQETLPFPERGRPKPFRLPELEMLARGVEGEEAFDRDLLIQNSQILEHKLLDFGVKGRVVKVHPGPVITMYEFEPAAGIKVARIVNLADDLALALRALTVRIVAPIPGKSVVGIEVPNTERQIVVMRDLLSHQSYHDAESKLTIALGKDIFGNPVVMDLSRMPHLLIAGATGTGKSVFLNALLCSLFFRATPEEVKLLLIDPKMLEFSVFQGVPHLIAEVVTDPKRAAAALLGVVRKMEERYRLMAEARVRNIEQYNRQVRKELAHARPAADDEHAPRPLPYIVVVIDELADLMIVAQRDVEESLIRLAQMARAAGIHLVLATQRPSVDVLTGIIKANFPARISFQVSSRTDSRTVLDANGAERLLGAGDMLFIPPGSSKLERIHGPYISEKDVQALTDHLREQGSPDFDHTLLRIDEERTRKDLEDDQDELFDSAVDVVARHRIASISFVQRKLKIGYNRAARLVEQMEDQGMVGPQEGTKARQIFLRLPDA